MHVVIFEVETKNGALSEYLEIATALRHDLEKIDGFISIERFESMANAGKYVSISYWRDEEAISNWRSLAKHQKAQAKGIAELFDGYRIRVAEVVRDYSMTERSEALQDQPKLG